MTNFLLEIALKAARIPPVQIFKTGASSKTWPKELLQKLYPIMPLYLQNTQTPCTLNMWDLNYTLSIIETDVVNILYFPSSRAISEVLNLPFLCWINWMPSKPKLSFHLHTCLYCQIISPRESTRVISVCISLLRVALVSLHPSSFGSPPYWLS